METVRILASIIFINLLLSGDNAVVIALASRSLPHQKQKKAILWGSIGAVVLRVLLTFGVVFILAVPYLQLIASLLLLSIAIKLLQGESESKERIAAISSLAEAIKMIITADFIMSLDNVIAIAAVAKGNLVYLFLGLALSIPIIMFGSRLVQQALSKWPVLIWLGSIFLGWTAGDMAGADRQTRVLLSSWPALLELLPSLFACFVLAAGLWLKRKRA